MDRADMIWNLKYMASSPPLEYGGFHPNVVDTAKAVLDFMGIEDTEWKIEEGN